MLKIDLSHVGIVLKIAPRRLIDVPRSYSTFRISKAALVLMRMRYGRAVTSLADTGHMTCVCCNDLQDTSEVKGSSIDSIQDKELNNVLNRPFGVSTGHLLRTENGQPW